MSMIKICGLFRPCDIDYVNEAGPDYIGFILHFPKSHRNISEVEAAALRSRLKEGIKAVGVFVDRDIETVVHACEAIPLDVIQLHGHETEDYIAALRERTSLPVWKAFRVKSEEDLQKAQACGADEILLDSGYGSGEAFDWSLVSSFSRPFILAGGLTPQLLPEALRMRGVKMADISSGVETDRRKDREKIMAAVRAAHETEQKEGTA